MCFGALSLPFVHLLCVIVFNYSVSLSSSSLLPTLHVLISDTHSDIMQEILIFGMAGCGKSRWVSLLDIGHQCWEETSCFLLQQEVVTASVASECILSKDFWVSCRCFPLPCCCQQEIFGAFRHALACCRIGCVTIRPWLVFVISQCIINFKLTELQNFIWYPFIGQEAALATVCCWHSVWGNAVAGFSRCCRQRYDSGQAESETWANSKTQH